MRINKKTVFKKIYFILALLLFGLFYFSCINVSAVHALSGAHSVYSCQACHFLDPSTNTFAKRGVEQESLCVTCHVLGGDAENKIEVGMHRVEGRTRTIDCGSCHNIHGQVTTDATHHTGKTTTYNAKLIRKDTDTYVAGALTPAIYRSEPGSFAFDGSADGSGRYDGICQSCHTQTKYHRNDGTAPGDPSADTGYGHPFFYNGLALADTACTDCHVHKDSTGDAWAIPNCHSQPPATGKHAKHVTDMNFTCDTCHFERGAGTAYHLDGTRDINFKPDFPNATRNNNSATYTRGGSPNTGTCNNVYCHGNFTAGNNQSPTWDTVYATNTCTDAPCHNTPPPQGAHEKHAGSTYAYQYPCTTCHSNWSINGTTHVDGTKDVTFDSSSLAYHATYFANPAFDSGAQTCSGVYCHSNGTAYNRGTDGGDPVDGGPISWFSTTLYTPKATPTGVTTPRWDTGSITTCVGVCHAGGADYVTGLGPDYFINDSSHGNATNFPVTYMDTGSHTKNAHQSLSAGIIATPHLWSGVQCFWCHETDSNIVTADKRQGTYGTSYHVDGAVRYFPNWITETGLCIEDRFFTQATCEAAGNTWYVSPQTDKEGGVGSMYYEIGNAYNGSNSRHCGSGKTCW